MADDGPMRISWHAALGGLAGLAAAATWALGSAVYQPLMEPADLRHDGVTVLASTAENNTYWPREVRHLAVLLAFAGIVVLCRSATRGIVVGAVAAGGWLVADLLLDRFDVGGARTAVVLGAAAAVYIAAAAAVAVRLSRARPGGPAARHVAAGTLALLAVSALLVVSPWYEPRSPAQARVEVELTAIKIALAALFAGLAAAVIGRPAAHRRTALGCALAAGVAGLLMVTLQDTGFYPLAMLAAFVTANVAVAAPRVAGRRALAGLAALSACCAFPALVAVYLGGMVLGGLLTGLAGNPPVHSADLDVTFPLVATVGGVAMALLTLAFTALPAALRAVGADRPETAATPG